MLGRKFASSQFTLHSARLCRGPSARYGLITNSFFFDVAACSLFSTTKMMPQMWLSHSRAFATASQRTAARISEAYEENIPNAEIVGETVTTTTTGDDEKSNNNNDQVSDEDFITNELEAALVTMERTPAQYKSVILHQLFKQMLETNLW